jgi:histidinol-phosphate phosphatase family protein
VSLRPALFIDRDGTLITNRPHSNDPAGICWYPGVFSALRAVQSRGFDLVLVSNQSAVARGYCRIEDVERFHAVLNDRLCREGVHFCGFYFSPYHPDGSVPPYNCDHPDRKPGPGMLLRAALAHGLDLSRSWMIGDGAVDLGAGRNAGCRTVLVLTGHGRRTLAAMEAGDSAEPDGVVAHLGMVCGLIRDAVPGRMGT